MYRAHACDPNNGINSADFSVWMEITGTNPVMFKSLSTCTLLSLWYFFLLTVSQQRTDCAVPVGFRADHRSYLRSVCARHGERWICVVNSQRSFMAGSIRSVFISIRGTRFPWLCYIAIQIEGVRQQTFQFSSLLQSSDVFTIPKSFYVTRTRTISTLHFRYFHLYLVNRVHSIEQTWQRIESLR